MQPLARSAEMNQGAVSGIDPADPPQARRFPGALTLDPLPVETGRVLFDLTRLLLLSRRSFGTGVDRIDLAIGRSLAERFGENCLFVHAASGGPLLLPHEAGAAFLDGLWGRWHGEGERPRSVMRLISRITASHARTLFGKLNGRLGADVTYVNASHAGLPQRRGALAALDPGRHMKRLAYLHDLIPIEFPEYQTPGTAERFRIFLQELTAAPVRLLTNSADTARRVTRHAARMGWPVTGATPLVPRLAPCDRPQAPLRLPVRRLLDDPRPYCVVIGTIEPRKNHLLLLHLWRDMAREGTPPRLVVIGRRGWENEMVVDLLERSAVLAPHVVECGDLSDAETHALLGRARALLMPSFTEGLGLPLLEAGAMGVPAIVSDLPALREIGAPGTVYLDPLDGPAWRAAITALAEA
jgi:glycosyltransferase involved in cell wall biosynthesis